MKKMSFFHGTMIFTMNPKDSSMQSHSGLASQQKYKSITNYLFLRP